MTDTASAAIRPYRPEDDAALYDICVRTADAGGDARGSYRDHSLPGDVFAVNYAHLEPELAFVLDDGERAVGYVLGTADTVRFARRMRDEWLPIAGLRHPEPAGPPADRDEEIASALHHPERMVRPEFAPYPAHLHIDLLPGFQRRGHGRRLLFTELRALRAAGAHAVYLGVLTANTPALAFYAHLGFDTLDVPDVDGITYVVRSTDAP